MRYIILSDVHGRHRKLAAALDDAQARGAHQVICLGDVGGDDCLSLLKQAGALAVFGNYEVSSWTHLGAKHKAWVRDWPPLLAEDGFLAVHAAPTWPQELRTIQDFGRWLRRTGLPWRTLFPYLRDEDDLWQSLAELERSGKQILFHGHTHQQAIWRWEPAGRLQRVAAAAVEVDPEQRYVVGVGSVGLPEDGGWAQYCIYDDEVGRVEFVQLG